MGGGSHGAAIIRDAGKWSRERSSSNCERIRGGQTKATWLLHFCCLSLFVECYEVMLSR